MDVTELIYTVSRYASIVEGTAIVGLILIVAHLGGGWKKMAARDRFRLTGAAGTCGTLAYGSAEALVLGVPGGLRSVLSAVALGYVLIAYYMILKDVRRATAVQTAETSV